MSVAHAPVKYKQKHTGFLSFSDGFSWSSSSDVSASSCLGEVALSLSFVSGGMSEVVDGSEIID